VNEILIYRIEVIIQHGYTSTQSVVNNLISRHFVLTFYSHSVKLVDSFKLLILQ